MNSSNLRVSFSSMDMDNFMPGSAVDAYNLGIRNLSRQAFRSQCFSIVL